MTTIRDMLIRDLRAIGAEGVACGSFEWTIEDLGSLPEPPVDRLSGPAKEAALIFARPAFRDDDGRLVPLPDWLECHGDAMCQGRGPHGEEVQVWCYGSDHFGLWIGRYATSDEEDDIELVSGDFPTAPAAWRAAEQWIKEQGR